jgi:CheY-like chemotaxis protein/anti-sigma regulatory factor (Ser/Thr protein kinase)
MLAMKEIRVDALVLVVDDDPVARHLVTRLLEHAGYTVVAEASGEAAQAAFESRAAASFDCIVTDYQMPGLNGVDLLASVRTRDPNIAAILVTAEGEQQLVEESLRAGFVDFLNKPVSMTGLNAAVVKAVTATRRMRSVADLTRNVEQAGLTQKRLLTSEFHKGLLNAEVYARPIQQAGGDFFSHILVSPTEEVVLIADVSGHDLSAAYISAYFQGMVRGMLESGEALHSVLQRFNRFLIEESEGQSEGGSVSISACGMHFDAASSEVSIVSCGAPPAVFASPSGATEVACGSAAHPLGWFADNPIVATKRLFTGGEFLFWTDGLSDLATALNVSPLSLVHSVLTARKSDPEPAWLNRASDDILAARIQLREKPERLHTIVDESYGPQREQHINDLQKYWRNSILAATYRDQIRPDCTCLYDAMLCAREALLNALRYGCQPDETTRFQISCREDIGLLRISVSDRGPGHSFDFSAHEQSDRELPDLHRGLLLIRSLPGRLTSFRRGAELIMDFFWKGELI